MSAPRGVLTRSRSTRLPLAFFHETFLRSAREGLTVLVYGLGGVSVTLALMQEAGSRGASQGFAVLVDRLALARAGCLRYGTADSEGDESGSDDDTLHGFLLMSGPPRIALYTPGWMRSCPVCGRLPILTAAVAFLPHSPPRSTPFRAAYSAPNRRQRVPRMSTTRHPAISEELNVGNAAQPRRVGPHAAPQRVLPGSGRRMRAASRGNKRRAYPAAIPVARRALAASG